MLALLGCETCFIRRRPSDQPHPPLDCSAWGTTCVRLTLTQAIFFLTLQQGTPKLSALRHSLSDKLLRSHLGGEAVNRPGRATLFGLESKACSIVDAEERGATLTKQFHRAHVSYG